MTGVEDDDPLLSIGAFARRARLSPKALRLYDRQGLLAPDRVDAVTGYRYYRESRLATARLIVRLRGLDMPLARIAEVLTAPAPEAAALVAGYWEGVERRVAAQRELAVHLRIQLSGGREGMDMYEIKQREVPEQLVLTERRHVRPEDLPVWIPQACDRLEEEAKAYGGVFAAPFVVYHGQVNEDSDGPAEVCVPIDPARAADVTTAVRTEPAHREAYTTITKAQVEYPQILSAYEAVYQWIEANGGRETGPSREVYFADWAASGPATEVCDIAVPMA
ncbi:MerR family transcriptional regulator [Streptomyces griseocarneus]|uniref:MerR family transcriptional regulator n=1 Tax=Streptomyces griseocarneus TaxID=51201 RepID=UPI00167EE5B8|nr:MerR family transcriptional regulator [Streptomyces griseocarneus]MBZ6475133.1 MerR family transcriptional regulator [Streptomyces griseocarneus]GHG62080.1 MerR family transcriptional regulator [Streptomyces griseocarneus]